MQRTDIELKYLLQLEHFPDCSLEKDIKMSLLSRQVFRHQAFVKESNRPYETKGPLIVIMQQ